MENKNIKKISDNIRKVIVGKDKVIELAIVGLISQGHILIEDVPGVGKTMLGRALARSINGVFKRIQFTPDLLPSDITGSSVFDPRTREFEFKPGPIFGNIILADEINRGTPRTQSSLLECMNESQVTADGVSHKLPQVFLVIATQNPIELEGTYPLLISELDRFMMRIKMGYPDKKDEEKMVTSHRVSHPIDSLEPVMELTELIELQERVKKILVEDSITNYIVDIVSATRNSDAINLGASPRSALFLYRAGQANALLKGRDFCVPDDVKEMAVPVLSLRIMPGGIATHAVHELQEELIRDIINKVRVPM